jgi:hypothetical protein
MPKYVPLVANPAIKASQSDLIELRWRRSGIIADFIIPQDDANAFRVCFDRVEIIRILDEMPLSTEVEETSNEGLVRDNFAYTIEGATFWRYQSEAFKTVEKMLRHYRFITGWTCLDVISNSEPAFVIVPLNR